FCNTNPEPVRPVTEPAIFALTAAVVQATATEVTLAEAVPLPLVTTQLCDGLLGWVSTVTAYAEPTFTAVLNVKFPVAVTDKLSPPLFCSTRPVPASPVTAPPMVTVPPVPPVELELLCGT